MSTCTLPSIELSQSGGLPMYRELKDRLASLIRKDFQPGQRFFSYRDIATASGVSRITAQLAVKELIREGLLKQQTPRITVVSAPQDHVSVTPIHAVGVVLSQWDTEGKYARNDSVLLNTLSDVAAQHRTHLQIISYKQVLDAPEVFDARVRDGKLDGLIWLSMRVPASMAASRWMGRELPQVAIMSRPMNLNMPLVTEDNYHAAFDAANLLLDEGHKRFLVIHSTTEILTYHDRLAGVREAFAQRGVALEPENFLETGEAPQPTWVPLAIQQALERIRPTAIIQAGNTTKITVPIAAKLGLEAGRDFEIIGFNRPYPDENLQNCCYRYFEPRLPEIGKLALETWLHCFERHQAGELNWHGTTRSVPMDLIRQNPEN